VLKRSQMGRGELDEANSLWQPKALLRVQVSSAPSGKSTTRWPTIRAPAGWLPLASRPGRCDRAPEPCLTA